MQKRTKNFELYLDEDDIVIIKTLIGREIRDYDDCQFDGVVRYVNMCQKLYAKIERNVRKQVSNPV